MYDHLIKGLMVDLNAMADMDFAKMPALVFMSQLRDQLVFTSFSLVEAEAIVTAMDIVIPPGILSDEQIAEFVTTYCKLICRMRDALTTHGFQDPVNVIVKMAPRLGLKFE